MNHHHASLLTPTLHDLVGYSVRKVYNSVYACEKYLYYWYRIRICAIAAIGCVPYQLTQVVSQP